MGTTAVSEPEAFLNRWSRRKAAARQEERQEAAAESRPDQPPAPAAPGEGREEPPDEETKRQWIAELEAVEIEKLTYDDDFSRFMKSWVPAALRQKALRKLWTTNPALACLDGLDDYCGDFTDAATVVPNVGSSWIPGKGYGWLDELAKTGQPAGEEEPSTATAADAAEPDHGEPEGQKARPGEASDPPDEPKAT